MNRRPSGDSAIDLAARESGITLIEVLTAIFIMGVGLLAVLTLFPLGALDMAQAIKDDRAQQIAVQAAEFSAAAEKAISQTTDFVQESLVKGSVDFTKASELQAEYQQLTVEAADIELQIDELQSALPHPQIQRYAAPLKAQIRWIGQRLQRIDRLFFRLGSATGPPTDSF